MKTRLNGAILRCALVTFFSSVIFGLPVLLATFDLPSFAAPYDRETLPSVFRGEGTTINFVIWIFAGAVGPALGAIAGWHHLAGKEGLRTLWHHLIDLRRSPVWVWLAPFILVGLIVGVPLVIAFVAGDAMPTQRESLGFGLPLLLFALVAFIGEELAFRGTLTPFLQETKSVFLAAILVGLFWGWWHLPSQIMGGAASGNVIGGLIGGLTFPIATIPGALITSALFNRAHGAIYVVVIEHALFNWSQFMVGIRHDNDAGLQEVLPIYQISFVVTLWLVALATWWFLGRNRPKVTATTMLAASKPHG